MDERNIPEGYRGRYDVYIEEANKDLMVKELKRRFEPVSLKGLEEHSAPGPQPLTSSELFRKVRQHLGYFDLLRTYLLAGTALQAGGRLLFRRQRAQGHGRDEPAAGVRVLVVQGQ